MNCKMILAKQPLASPKGFQGPSLRQRLEFSQVFSSSVHLEHFCHNNLLIFNPTQLWIACYYVNMSLPSILAKWEVGADRSRSLIKQDQTLKSVHIEDVLDEEEALRNGASLLRLVKQCFSC